MTSMPDFRAFDTSEGVSWIKSPAAQTQIEMEQQYSKSQLLPTTRADFLERFSHGLQEVVRLVYGLDSYDDHPRPFSVAFLAELMAQASIRKRAPLPVFVGILVKHFEGESQPYQTCADAIVAAASYDVVTLAERTLPGSVNSVLEIILLHEVSPETQARIEQFQYPLPMVEPPLIATCNRHTGYHTIKGSLILKNNHHEDDICLDHINRMNAIPLAVNSDVVAFVQNSWKNLEKQKPGETYVEFQQRRKAFQKYDRVSRDVLAAMMIQPDGFWLTHRYDKRGRTYSQGYHCNYQGNDWNKSVVMLQQKEKLNPE